MNVWKFNKTLTNDDVSFVQPGPDLYNFVNLDRRLCYLQYIRQISTVSLKKK